MLSKCANSACVRSFRYLHEGKLFWREPARNSSKNRGLRGEWFWLCDHCLALWVAAGDPVAAERGLSSPAELSRSSMPATRTVTSEYFTAHRGVVVQPATFGAAYSD